MNLIVRKAVPADAAALAEILVSSWRAAYGTILSEEELEKQTNPKQRTLMFQKMLANPRGEFYIALDGTIPCGQLMFCKARDSELTETAEIVSVYAVPEYWGKGVGKAMMECALNEISAQGYRQATLWVFRENLRARSFYEKFGFVADGSEKTGIFSGDHSEIRYIRSIVK